VTAPLKTAWAAAGVVLDPDAAEIGAANTLKRASTGWQGANFDVDGFLAPLGEQGVAVRDKRCVVLGAGGAARAAIAGLRREGARVEVSARRNEAARDLAAAAGASAAPWPPPPGWDLLVNATPAGTFPRSDELPLPAELVRGPAVYDLVYHPRETALLRAARAAGARAIDGLDMLVAQAALQFEYWFERPAPRGVMRQAAEDYLQKAER
jgi:shikimate dehydrogenase